MIISRLHMSNDTKLDKEVIKRKQLSRIQGKNTASSPTTGIPPLTTTSNYLTRAVGGSSFLVRKKTSFRRSYGVSGSLLRVQASPLVRRLRGLRSGHLVHNLGSQADSARRVPVPDEGAGVSAWKRELLGQCRHGHGDAASGSLKRGEGLAQAISKPSHKSS